MHPQLRRNKSRKLHSSADAWWHFRCAWGRAEPQKQESSQREVRKAARTAEHRPMASLLCSPSSHSHIHSLQLTQFCFLPSCGGPTQLRSRASCLKMSKQGKQKRNTLRSLLLASECNHLLFYMQMDIYSNYREPFRISHFSKATSKWKCSESLSPQWVSLLSLFFPWRFLPVPVSIPNISLEKPSNL